MAEGEVTPKPDRNLKNALTAPTQKDLPVGTPGLGYQTTEADRLRNKTAATVSLALDRTTPVTVTEQTLIRTLLTNDREMTVDQVANKVELRRRKPLEEDQTIPIPSLHTKQFRRHSPQPPGRHRAIKT